VSFEGGRKDATEHPCNEAALGVCGVPGVLQLQPPTRFQETGQQCWII
jgi:hypothetical protein